MSTITNEPILLDSTGREMLNKMDRMNGLLAMIAEGKRSEVYSNISQVASIVRGNSLEENIKLFPVGDQIIVPWKDMDDSNHNTDETAYQVIFNIGHHEMVTLETGEEVPGMFLQFHHCSPYGVQFSHQQAFLNCPDGLVAGTYIVGLASNWGTHAVGDTEWAFTLTQDVPAGGRLSGFEGMPDQASSNWRVKSWATPDAAEPIETVTVTQATDETAGTKLGTMPLNNPDEETGLNCMQSVAYGHNRWKTSALRQYLNSSGTDWWKSQEDFDIRPDQYAKSAFMSGFSYDFLNAIKPIKVQTALNTVEGYTNTYDVTYDRFFPLSLEQMYVVPQIEGEGAYWEYWRSRLGVSTPVAQYGTYPNLITTGIDNPSTAQNGRLRSAYRGNSCNTWYVGTSGTVHSTTASRANRFSPACVIC